MISNKFVVSQAVLDARAERIAEKTQAAHARNRHAKRVAKMRDIHPRDVLKRHVDEGDEFAIWCWKQLFL